MTALLKQPTIRSKRLMEWARDHPAGCQARFPDWCDWGPTCGSHIPDGVRFGKGAANKPPDVLIALTCNTCHGICDNRIKTGFEPEFIRLVWHEAHCATEVLMVQDGMIEVPSGGNMTKWRSIKTAPRDGTDVLLWMTDDYGMPGLVVIGGWRFTDQYGHRWRTNHGHAADEDVPHWMPLPEPPEGE